MPGRKKASLAKRRIVAGIFIAIALAIGACVAAGFIASRITHVERVTLLIEDLPENFDGATLLYVSDIDMVGVSTPGGVARLFEKLQKLNPDILILGGDYANPSLLHRINNKRDELAL